MILKRNSIQKYFKTKQIVVLGTLLFICLLQILLYSYYGKQKTYLMCDELFSYTSANHVGVQPFDIPLNEWLDKEWYVSQGAVMEGQAFDYTNPYQNQVSDVHPPIFYILLHTLSSFVPGEISIATGVGLNIFFMLGCTLLLYLLAKEIFKGYRIGLLVAALFGLTYGACNTVLFVRMYTIFMFFILAHTYVYIKFMDEKRITWKVYVLLGGTLVLGVLTHYYFILMAFFLAVWYFIKLWLEKRFREQSYLHVTIEICALICLAVFPAMWNHIFNDYRGIGAKQSLMELSGFRNNLKAMFHIINEQLFGGFFWWILLAVFLLLGVYIYKIPKFPWKELEKLYPVGIMSIGYFALVTKIAPFMTDRYLMPIYPFVYLIVAGGSCWLLEKLIPEKVACALGLVAFLGLSMGKLNQETPGYAYKNFLEHTQLASEYADTYCVYIDREFNWWEYYSVIQLLKEYKSFYCISYAAIIDDIGVAMQALENEEQVIVFVGDSELNEEITTFIQGVVGAEEMELIDEYDRWKIYLGKREGEIQ